MRVLLAEDDEYLLSALTHALKHKDYTVDGVRSGTEANAALLSAPYDLVLLDLGLPGMDGTNVLSELRKRGEDMPVIVITARDRVEDRIHGLDIGANDYLVKPFDFRELEARMRAVLRKSHWRNQLELEFGSLKLNTNSGRLCMSDQELDLTPKESCILHALMSKAGQVVNKRLLVEQVSDWKDESSENAVEIVIHRLRKKLEAADVSINTVRGFGYVLEEKK
ncbi:MAG TPA: response regulator [Candidatus Melainabacteria bacterium]|nr:response regulator [Candidatus Melainabacteria bacterium]HIN67341.1 response regulator [Candidatus Obscuribacterales bacterium]